jgi:hypothetical protein
LLLLDENNPRSCAFQLVAIETHLRELPRITLAQRSDVPRTVAQEMRGTAANANPARLAFCESGARPGLIELTDTIISSAAELSGCYRRRLFPACQPYPHRRRLLGGGLDGVSTSATAPPIDICRMVSHSWHLAHCAPAPRRCRRCMTAASP